jgi:hypothetical protein
MRTCSRKDHGAGVSQKNVNASNPSPASTLDDVVAQLASVNAVLRQIAQPATSVQHGRYNSDVAVLYMEFLSMQPPVFSKVEDPLEAEDWLRTIEKKLGLIHCDDIQKVQCATQQLQGPTGLGGPNTLHYSQKVIKFLGWSSVRYFGHIIFQKLLWK